MIELPLLTAALVMLVAWPEKKRRGSGFESVDGPFA